MNGISIIAEKGESFSSVPNLFIDYYMTDANGEFVKIYLYILRLMQAERSIAITDIADHFHCTQKDICRALRYWVDKKLLRLEHTQSGELYAITVLHVTQPKEQKESDQNSGLDLLSETQTKTQEQNRSASKIYAFPAESATSALSEEAEAPAVPEKKRYTPAQLRTLQQTKEKDHDMNEILNLFEMYWGHTPSGPEFNSLVYLYDQLEQPIDLIEYLIEYCSEVEKTNWKYMERIAINWYERGIASAEVARKEHDEFRSLNNAITKELSLQRVLTKTELEYINTWKNDYDFGREFIIEACKRACSENRIKFSYIHGILKNWHEADVKTMEDIKRLDAQKSSATPSKVRTLPQNNYPQRKYNLDDNFFIQELADNAKKASEQ